MYHFFRRIHLVTGLILVIFVMMYFISGYIIVHANWFGGREPKTSSETISLDLPRNISEPALREYLQKTLRLRGQPGAPDHRNNGSTRFSFVYPRATVQVTVTPETSQITIDKKEFGFAGVANGMHRLRGYRGGWLYWIWSLLYDLASFALIVFGTTGIYLWYKSTARHLPGWCCLAASFGFTTAMILFLMLSR